LAPFAASLSFSSAIRARQAAEKSADNQGCQVADLSAIFADFGLMEKLLAEWKNPIRPLPKVAESDLIESILSESIN
jgi:hypothetical protein